MRAEDPGPLASGDAKQELLVIYGPMVDDGIAHLRRAIEIDQQFEDAMAYLNLLIRERADLRDTAQQYEQDIQEADDWVQHVLDTKKEKARQASAGQISRQVVVGQTNVGQINVGQISGIEVRAGMLTSPQAVSASRATAGGPVSRKGKSSTMVHPIPLLAHIRITGECPSSEPDSQGRPGVSRAGYAGANPGGWCIFTVIISKDGTLQNIEADQRPPALLLVPAAL